MKASLKKLSYLFITVLFLSACTSGGGEKSISQQTAESALEVIKLTDEYYDATERSIYELRHKSDKLNVLTAGRAFPEKTTGKQMENLRTDINSLQKLIASFSSLYNAYYKIEVLGLSKEQADFAALAGSCVEYLKEAKPDSVNSLSIQQLEEAVAAYQTSMPSVMYALNEEFTGLVRANLTHIDRFLADYYQQYSEGLKNVPSYKFDTLKVEQMVSDPYSDKQVLIKIYKLQMEDEVYGKVQSLQNRAKIITDLLQELNLLHAEYMKQNRTDGNIKKRLLRINELSGRN